MQTKERPCPFISTLQHLLSSFVKAPGHLIPFKKIISISNTIIFY